MLELAFTIADGLEYVRCGTYVHSIDRSYSRCSGCSSKYSLVLHGSLLVLSSNCCTTHAPSLIGLRKARPHLLRKRAPAPIHAAGARG